MTRQWREGDLVRLPDLRGVKLPHDRGTVEGTDVVTGREIVKVYPPVPKDAPGTDVGKPTYGTFQGHELQEVASLD